MTLPDIRTVADLKGKRVLLRAGLNVPVVDGVVANDFRIRKALLTLRFLREQGARVVIAAHIGRERSETLRPVYEALQKHVELSFVPDIVGEQANAALGGGDIVLLENLRQHDGETTNDESFARGLASLADIYVNDAFDSSHREHASITGVPKLLPHYAGIQLQEEVAHLGRALSPESPSLVILGGAKFDTKEPLIKKLLDAYDTVFVGGALANDIFKAGGLEVGHSRVSDRAVDASLTAHERVLVPIDVVVTDENGETFVKSPGSVLPGEAIVDAGPETVALLVEKVGAAKAVLWNGPLGIYEQGFSKRTEELAQAIANSDAQSIVGGGDTVASIAKLKLEEKFTFVSTGGGAMLEFLEKGTLPGLDALQ